MAAAGTGLLLHAASTPAAHRNAPLSTPTVKAPAMLTPGASIYPSLIASYTGTARDLMTVEDTALFLTNVQQSQGDIQGSFQGLGLTGSFKGTVSPSGQLQFTVKIYAGSMALIFEGNIKTGGDMLGIFSVVDQHGQRTGEAGLWNVSPSR
jgi:hypothetical protein